MNRKLIAVPAIALAAGLSLAACGAAGTRTAARLSQQARQLPSKCAVQ
jgi:hypothetical protein